MTDAEYAKWKEQDRRSPAHLGDGVYVAHDGCQVWLRVNNADWGEKTAEVALEPSVLLELLKYAKRMGFVIRTGERND